MIIIILYLFNLYVSYSLITLFNQTETKTAFFSLFVLVLVREHIRFRISFVKRSLHRAQPRRPQVRGHPHRQRHHLMFFIIENLDKTRFKIYSVLMPKVLIASNSLI